MKSQSAFKTLVIPKDSARPVAITGSSLYIKSATGLVDLQFDEGTTLRCESGQTVSLPTGDFFKQIIFTNPDTNTALTIQYYAGTLEIGNRTPYVFTRPAPTYLVGVAYTGGAQVTTAADTTIPQTNLRLGKNVADSRAYCIIFARSATSGLQVKDSAGTICGYVQTMTAWQITTSDVLKLRADAANMDVYVANFFNYDS